MTDDNPPTPMPTLGEMFSTVATHHGADKIAAAIDRLTIAVAILAGASVELGTPHGNSALEELKRIAVEARRSAVG